MSTQRAHVGLLRGAAASVYDAETVAWYTGISAAGGSVTTQEKDWAEALILAIRAASYGAKIIYLLPFLGANIKAARMPLRDTFARGIASSYGSSPFVDGDVGNAVGIENPTEKLAYLGTGLPINWNAGNGNKGGFGFWERNWGNGTNVEAAGAYDASGGHRFLLDFRSSFRRFRWGGTTQSEAGPATSMANGHYYGQYNGTQTQLWKDGATDGAANTTGPFATGADVNELMVMGVNAPTDTPYKGRCAVFYVTDGTMSGADVTAFHTLLGTYLVTPTGR